MLGQVVVAAIRDTLELVPTPRVEELNIRGAARVVRQIRRGVLVEPQHLLGDAEPEVPVVAGLDPVAVPLVGLTRGDEELHLHLLELAGSKHEVLRGYLIAERLSDLCDAERRLLAHGREHVREIREHALGRLGPQVRRGALPLDRAGLGLEHEVEGPRFGELRRSAVRAHSVDLVLAPSLLAFATVDQRVGEGLEVTRCRPHRGRTEDCRVDPDDVGTHLDHRTPPGLLDVAQHVDAQRAVVVRGTESPVDLRGLEDESTALGQVRHLLQQFGVQWGGRFHPTRLLDYSALLRRMITWLARSRPSGARVTSPSRTCTRWRISSSESKASAATPRGVRRASDSRSKRWVRSSRLSTPPRGR